MTRYCSNCGRFLTIDGAKVCPYCGKPIPFHDGQILSEPEQKKDRTVLIVVAVVVVLLIAPIAIAATVYVYVSGMIGSTPLLSTPYFYLSRNNTAKTLTVSYIYFSSSIPWEAIQIQGSCNTSLLGTYVTKNG